jgi:hypothetical protein
MVEVAEIESASKMVNLSGHSQVYLTYSQVSKVSTISHFLCGLGNPLIPTVGLSPIMMR